MQNLWAAESNNTCPEYCVTDFGSHMQDILWIVLTVLFFAIGIAYVKFCDAIR